MVDDTSLATEATRPRRSGGRPTRDDAARRLARVLTNDPATGVMRHADAGYEAAKECAREQGLDLPMLA